MKIIKTAIIALASAGVIVGGFWAVNHRAATPGEVIQLTEVQKLIARNMESNYPETPRGVVKLYNRFMELYYAQDYTDEEFVALTNQSLQLLDDDLAANNPLDVYQSDLRKDVEDYKERGRKIRSTNVCDSNEVVYTTDPNNGDELAYVTASYFCYEKSKYDRTYMEYVLKKDEEGRWKIRTYYKIVKKDTDEDL